MPEPSPLSDAQAQRLIKLYSEAEAEILGEINRLLMGPPKDYSLAWQRTILQRTQQIKADLLKGSRTWCQEAIPASYMKGVEWADKDPQSGQMVQAGFGSIHQQAVEVLADNAYSRLENVVHVVGRQVNDVYRKVALEAAKGSVIGYKTTKQAARDIRQDLAKHGITGFVDKAGHQWDMRRYARVLAQETTNGAFRHGTINRLEEKGHDLVRISSHAGSCKLCQPYQGQTFSLTGNDKEFPPLSSAKGLFHVGCLHVISLAPEEKDRFIGRLQGKEGASAREAEITRLAEKAGWTPAKAVKIKPPLQPAPVAAAAAGFVPAKNIREANKRLTDILTRGAEQWAERQNRLGLPDHRFRGVRGETLGKPKKMSLELANVVLERFEQYEKRCKALGIPMLKGMSGAGNYAGLMGDARLGLNYTTMERRLQDTAEKKIQNLEARIKRYDEWMAQANKTLEQNPGYEPSIKWLKELEEGKATELRRLKALQSNEPYDWFKDNPGKKPYVSTELYLDGKEQIISTIEHEFGHHIHQQLDVKDYHTFRYAPPLEVELEKAFFQGDAKANSPSRYGQTNPKEWFAENYTLYMTGKKDLVSKEILPIVEKIAKRQSE